MAEIVGLVASVIQVAGAGLKLSQTLYQYADGVATADRRIKDIAREIKLTSLVIDELGTVFGQDETAKLISKSAVATADETMKECSTVFAEIDATLTKSKNGRLGRMMLPFRDNKIELLRSHIDKLKSTLQLLMQVLVHAFQVSSNKLDRDAEARQRADLKELLELQRRSSRRYEDSLRNFSMSDTSTAIDDDQEEGDRVDDSSTVDAMTVAASAIGSTITSKSLVQCVQHVQSLLDKIKTLQQAFTQEEVGADHSDHHQALLGSYLQTRGHLDHVILGRSLGREPTTRALDKLSMGPLELSDSHLEPQTQKPRVEFAAQSSTTKGEVQEIVPLLSFHGPDSISRFSEGSEMVVTRASNPESSAGSLVTTTKLNVAPISEHQTSDKSLSARSKLKLDCLTCSRLEISWGRERPICRNCLNSYQQCLWVHEPRKTQIVDWPTDEAATDRYPTSIPPLPPPLSPAPPSTAPIPAAVHYPASMSAPEAPYVIVVPSSSHSSRPSPRAESRIDPQQFSPMNARYKDLVCSKRKSSSHNPGYPVSPPNASRQYRTQVTVPAPAPHAFPERRRSFGMMQSSASLDPANEHVSSYRDDARPHKLDVDRRAKSEADNRKSSKSLEPAKPPASQTNPSAPTTTQSDLLALYEPLESFDFDPFMSGPGIGGCSPGPAESLPAPQTNFTAPPLQLTPQAKHGKDSKMRLGKPRKNKDAGRHYEEQVIEHTAQRVDGGEVKGSTNTGGGDEVDALLRDWTTLHIQ